MRTLSLALTLVVLLTGPAAAALRIVATVPDLAAIASEVGGEHVTVMSLTRATQDPHFIDARPSLVLDLNRADLLVAVGLDLEVGWLPVLQNGARNARVQRGGRGFLDCSSLVRLLDVPAGPIDRSQGDVHPGGNPHYLRDPRAAAAVAAGIAARLAELDPARRAHYQERLAAFQVRLDAARAAVERRLAGLRGAPILTYHGSWVYLADWLGLEVVGTLEPKPGVPPSPAHVARMLTLARERGVKLLLQEAYYPLATSRVVATRIPAALVALPGGTDFHGGQRYPELIEAMGTAIAGGVER
jgi:zinc/manganese transport system substrate-binding protein